MDSKELKQLKKLAQICRKAGIKTYKGQGIEFTLLDEDPAPPRRHSKSKAAPIADSKPFEAETPTEEELLMWSAGGGVPFDLMEGSDDV